MGDSNPARSQEDLMPFTRLHRPIVVAAAAGTAAAAWAVVTQIAGVRLVVQFPHAHPSSVGLAATAGAAAAASIVGWVLLALLEPRASRPRRTWIGAAVAGTVASLALPILFASGGAALIGLVAIHLAVATVAIAAFSRTLANRSNRAPSNPVDQMPPGQASGGSRPGSFPSGRVAPGVAGSGIGGLSARLSSTSKLVVALVAAGLVFASAAGAAAAGVIKPPPMRGTGRPSVPAFLAAGSPGGTWGAGRPGGWPGRASADTESFDVASTAQPGPGAVVLTGPLDEGGIEHPGRSIDDAVFANGSFRIDHSAGQPTVRFDQTTCVGSISQVGPFDVIDATGPFTALQGHQGTYRFDVTYTTGRDAEGCTAQTTAYIETIHGVMDVGASAAAKLRAASSS
jgi:hypothetical protein